MHLYRLSRACFTPALAKVMPPPERPRAPTAYTPPCTIRIFAYVSTILLLLGAITLALLPLLSPEISKMPILSIRPVGHALARVPMVNGEPLGVGVQAVDPQIMPLDSRPVSGSPAVTKGELLEEVSQKGVGWYGLDGPRVLVGVLRICSKISPDEDWICTSASQAAFHAAFLPLSLGRSLFAMPESPPVPILLLVTSAGLILALITYIIPLLPWRTACRPLRCSSRRVLPEDDGESLHGLVQPPTAAPRGGSINWGFLVLEVASFAVTLAGIVLQLQIVQRAQDGWNQEEAEAIGLEFGIGASAYLLGFLPISIIVSILIALVPHTMALRHRLAKKRAEAKEEAEKLVVVPGFEFVPLREPPATAAPPNLAGREVRAVPVPQIQIVEPPAAEETITAGAGETKKSWRNTFGVGVAS